MAFSRLIHRNIAPIINGIIISGIALYPKTIINAESPEKKRIKKPIYDESDTTSNFSSATITSQNNTMSSEKPKSPTATDQLACEIRKARLFLYSHVSFIEGKVNDVLDSAFHLEESFTSTVASLAPAPHTGEKLMPGALYVIVAAMTGSIVARKSNILLRAMLPVTAGITAGSLLLPVTFRNISDLVWKNEQRFPVIADTHTRTVEAIEKAERMARIHSQQAVEMVNNKVSSTRKSIINWVSSER
ncbi:MICOS subunit MIC26 [Golovinomyces cichoracearum]|uniref:MICOS complex subunit n=1 Tax=Golovinomyces cichoracearum TaxID=62708 RepID=A0A420HUV3_9PEZI|nr:MICOS subunit MIC26 [Golovinomyces cichoracearum]